MYNHARNTLHQGVDRVYDSPKYNDPEPREPHKPLYGIIKPVDDIFWANWYPPNGWGCRCGVRQADSRPMPEKMQLPPPVMRKNPGSTGRLFSDAHPIIRRYKNKDEIEKQGMALERKFVWQKVTVFSANNYKNKTFLLDGKEVTIPMRSIGKLLSQSSDQYDYRNQLLLQLPAIRKNAKLVEEQPPKPANTIIERTFFYAFDAGGQTYYLVVRKYRVNGKLMLYTIVDKISKAP